MKLTPIRCEPVTGGDVAASLSLYLAGCPGPHPTNTKVAGSENSHNYGLSVNPDRPRSIFESRGGRGCEFLSISHLKSADSVDFSRRRPETK